MKKRLLAVLSAAVLCFAFLLSACSGKVGEITAEEFGAAVEAIVTPITKGSADSINGAYDIYYALGEEEQRAVEGQKEKLDGYAEICNAIVAVVTRSEEIGEYSLYSEYSKKIAAANDAYDALIKADASYKSDKDVAAAKAVIDKAQSVYTAKTTQIDEFVSAVSEIGEYSDTQTLYSEWAAKIAEAEEKYGAVSSAEDDMYTLPQVSQARLTLKGYNGKKAELEAVIAEFGAKVQAAGEAYSAAFGEGEPFYDDAVNSAFDGAEIAYIAAAAVNLTNDSVTEAIRGEWTALQGKYYGVRYTTEFEASMNGVEAMLGVPSMADELEEKLAAAEKGYAKIPEADRGKVAETKSLYDRAAEKLPELKAQYSFIMAAGGVDYASATDLNEVKGAIAEAQALWDTLAQEFGYTSGIVQVDDAKGVFDKKAAEFNTVKGYVDAVNALPSADALVNDKQTYELLSAAKELYEALTAEQKEYALISNAYMTYASADHKFEAQKTSVISESAWDKEGQVVAAGLNALAFDESTGLIKGDGARANYLQALYTAAAFKPEHRINGTVIDEENFANVDSEAVQAYMKENFEYVFTLYNAATGLKAGEVRKDMVYDEAAQVPLLEEMQPFFPVYHNESEEVQYTYGVALAVKENATDAELHYQLRNTEETKAEGTAKIIGSQDEETRAMLSPVNLIFNENNTNLQFMRSGSAVCAYGKALDYDYVGAYDFYLYLGTEAKDEALIDWVRTVPETQKVGNYPHTAGAYVRNFLGSSLEEKELAGVVMTDQEYISAGVTDITAAVLSTGGQAPHKNHGWMLSNKKGYGNAWAKISDMVKLFATLGYDIPAGSTVTIVARLRVNAAGAEAGVKDSPFSVPVQVTF